MTFIIFTIIYGVINFIVGMKEAVIVTGFLYAIYTIGSIGALITQKNYFVFAHWVICTGVFFIAYKVAVWRLKKEGRW